MHYLFFRSLVVVACLPAASLAQSAIDGTWKVDLASYTQPKKPVTYIVRDGMFECASCPGKTRIAADGRDQRIGGESDRDTLAVTLRDARTLETTTKKAGQVVSKVRLQVAADGKTLTRSSTDIVNGYPTVAQTIFTRVATGPAGSHWLSGSWRRAQVKKQGHSLVTFRTVGDTLSMSSPHGGSYTARLGGPPAAVKGDASTSTVSVRMKDPRTLEETAYRDGKLFIVTTLQVEPGGRKARVSWIHPQSRQWEARYMFVPDADGPTGSYTMTRQ